MKFYKMCAVQEFGSALAGPVLVKTDAWVNKGDLVGFRSVEGWHVGEILSVAYVSEGSSEEDVFKAVAPVYVAETIYQQSWAKEEEENNDGN